MCTGGRAPRGALIGALIGALAGGTAQAAPDAMHAPRIVVVFAPSGKAAAQVAPLSAESLTLALALQLEPRGFRVRRARWTGRAPARFDAALARVLSVRGASFGIGYHLDHGEISVWIAEATPHRLRRFRMGEPVDGLERSIAASIRTYVLAPAPADGGADAAKADAADATASRGDGSGAAHDAGNAATLRGGTRVGPAPRYAVGVDYRLDTYPVTSDLRHGPDVWLSARVWRQLEAVLTIGFRQAPSASGDVHLDPNKPNEPTVHVAGTRRYLHVAVSARWVLRPLRWLDVELGTTVRVGLGGAGVRQTDLNGNHMLAELMLGGVVGARFHLTPRWAIVVRGHVGAMLPGSDFTVGDTRLALTDGVELGASVGFHFGLL